MDAPSQDLPRFSLSAQKNWPWKAKKSRDCVELEKNTLSLQKVCTFSLSQTSRI